MLPAAAASPSSYLRGFRRGLPRSRIAAAPRPSEEADRGGAAAFRRGGSRRRHGHDVDILWRRATRPPEAAPGGVAATRYSEYPRHSPDMLRRDSSAESSAPRRYLASRLCVAALLFGSPSACWQQRCRAGRCRLLACVPRGPNECSRACATARDAQGDIAGGEPLTTVVNRPALALVHIARVRSVRSRATPRRRCLALFDSPCSLRELALRARLALAHIASPCLSTPRARSRSGRRRRCWRRSRTRSRAAARRAGRSRRTRARAPAASLWPSFAVASHGATRVRSRVALGRLPATPRLREPSCGYFQSARGRVLASAARRGLARG